jgi:hypothetical protein
LFLSGRKIEEDGNSYIMRIFMIHIVLHIHIYIYIYMYRVSQEERSIFWEVILSVILSKNRTHIHINIFA